MDRILVPLIVFTAIVLPIIFISRYRHSERMELIRQGINPASSIPAVPAVPGRKSLLWGLVLLFLGVGLLVYSAMIPEHEDSDKLKAGIICLSIGLALLIYWKVTAPDRQRLTKIYEEKLQAESASVVNKTPEIVRESPVTDETDTSPEETETT